jgi:tripartite-type tricarboxylate transporter receptor subunit TctC
VRISNALSATVAVVLLAAGAAHAQKAFPGKPLRILVGFLPGSGTDFLARTVGQKLADHWGQPVVVDNRPGAGGVIASDLARRAAADGHTLVVVANGHAVNASLMDKLPYDTLRDFAGVSYLADVPNLLGAAPSLKITTLRALIDYAKARPGQTNYATSGPGTATHISMELLKLATDLDIVQVAYKGSSETIASTIAGNVQYSFFPISTVTGLVTAGKLVGIAVSTKTRSPVLPNVPTVAESGVPGYDHSGWYALYAPAGTPQAVKDKLSQEVTRILDLPEIKERLLSVGATPHSSTPQKLDAFTQEEVARMAKLVQAAGLRVR